MFTPSEPLIMSAFCKYRLFLCFVFSLVVAKPAFANDPAYTQRQTDYINTALANFSGDAITLQAYQGEPLDSAALQLMINKLPISDVIDFDIVKLVRILYFTNGQYDSLIVPELNKLPFWLTKDEALRVYWSENHMILWMSSDWLMHERYGRAIDASLDTRLRHYLRMKVQYGYYEFFSSVYLPYSLTALLNLADFAQDVEIKALATQAAQRLLKDILMVTNDKGVYYPAAGRNYYSKYEQPYNQNHSHLIYLLTGMGPAPSGGSHAGCFLASSTLPVDSVISSWKPTLDTLYSIGHSLDSGLVLNAGQSFTDKVMFQWSSGAYFHPTVAIETATLFQDSSLWNHHEFSDFTSYSHLNISQAPMLAEVASAISKSSLICGQDIAIFKHNSVTLSSIHDFLWKGKLGYQQMPCVANVGTTSVLTASGPASRNWSDGSTHNANEHLPSVHQQGNVALVMYRPEKDGLSFFDHDSLAVVLRWDDADFDEVREDGFWKLGRQESGYIAVRRSCMDEVNGNAACDKPNGQAWVFVVGDSAMYGSFNNFQNSISQSQLEEQWWVDTSASQSVYYAKVVVDSVSIDYAWERDTLLFLSDAEQNLKTTDTTFSIFPNPVTREATLKLNAFANQPVTIKVVNEMGAIVHSEIIDQLRSVSYPLYTANWAEGLYVVVAQNESKLLTQKLIKAK